MTVRERERDRNEKNGRIQRLAVKRKNPKDNIKQQKSVKREWERRGGRERVEEWRE